MTQSTNRLGQLGEDLAAGYLEQHGYRIIARNWRTSLADVRGEIDVVAMHGATLVFCEVKSRRNAVADAYDAVTWSKQRQLRRLAGLYLSRHPHHGDLRFDVIAVTWPRHRDTAAINHIQSAF